MLHPFLDKMSDRELGGLSPANVGGALKMSVADLSRVTRLHRNTLARHPASPLVQARVGEVARIIAAAADLIGDDRRAAIWFRHQPLSGFGGQTAEELVTSGHEGSWPAIYLSEQIETAFAESQQELGVRPGTFVAYALDAAAVVDLTDPSTQAELDVAPKDLSSPWKTLAWVEGVTPPTWRLADRLVQSHAGARTPSVQYPGGTNLVLWRWNVAGAPSLHVLDPRGELTRT